MKITWIDNGSSGNSTIIENNDKILMIDCGLPLKYLPDNVNYILITHEHYDHIKTLEKYLKKYGIRNEIKVYLDKKVFLSNIDDTYLMYHDFKTKLILPEFEITGIELYHDVPCFGFNINNDYLHITDTGFISYGIKKAIKNNDFKVIYIESDYDEDELIANEDYDVILKYRINSNFGHLSNQQVLKFLNSYNFYLKKTNKIVIGHMSKNNNSLEILEKRKNEIISDEILKSKIVGSEKNYSYEF